MRDVVDVEDEFFSKQLTWHHPEGCNNPVMLVASANIGMIVQDTGYVTASFDSTNDSPITAICGVRRNSVVIGYNEELCIIDDYNFDATRRNYRCVGSCIIDASPTGYSIHCLLFCFLHLICICTVAVVHSLHKLSFVDARCRTPETGHITSRKVISVQPSPLDPYVIAAGYRDEGVKLWDLRRVGNNGASQPLLVSPYAGTNKAIAWNPNRRTTLCSGSGVDDRCVRIWDTSRQTTDCEFSGRSQICSVLWSNTHNGTIFSGNGYGGDLVLSHSSKYISHTKVILHGM